MSDCSWHGYGYKESVNVDFAEKGMLSHYDYEMIKQYDIMNGGSDHRPIVISIH